MTPKEKAEELVGLFNPFSSNEATTEYGFTYTDAVQLWNAKQCALIAVDEIMKAIGWDEMELGVDRDNYWQEVKQEIEKL